MDKKIIELIIDENDLQTGIHAVSVVHSPAIEENFIALSKHEIELKEVDAEKKILMGAALVPNKQILRADKDGNGPHRRNLAFVFGHLQPQAAGPCGCDCEDWHWRCSYTGC